MESPNTYLGKFVVQHPDNWKELLTNNPYNLKIVEDDNYILFKYNQLTADFDIPLVREARGIIFNKDDFSVPVCHAFDKFGNYGESYCPEIDWNTSEVTEKIDGSLIKVWYDNDKWHISTNGLIDAFESYYLEERGIQEFKMSYGQLFIDTLEKTVCSWDTFTDSLSKDTTYMFELVGPQIRVVIPYSENQIYFLGSRNNITNVEKSFTISPLMRTFRKLLTPKVYPLFNLSQVQQAASELPWDEEGYVVRDSFGNKVKIKSLKYVKAHYNRNNNIITTKNIIEVILSHEENEFVIYCDDSAKRLYRIKNLMQAYKEDCINVRVLMKATKFSNRGEYAASVKKAPKYTQPFLFYCYDHNEDIEEFTKNWSADKWLKALRAMENYFDGVA